MDSSRLSIILLFITAGGAMKKLSLPKIITLILSGSTLALDASASTLYNAFNAYNANIGTDADTNRTDGWTYQYHPSRDHSITHAWVGTSGGAMPFGLTNYEVPVANWAVELQSPGSGSTVSSQNAFDSYGVWADIDTTAGAWNDGELGTIYNMDVGLFKSNVTQQITLAVSNINPAGWQNFGINVYAGNNQMHSEVVYEPTGSICCDAQGGKIHAS